MRIRRFEKKIEGPGSFIAGGGLLYKTKYIYSNCDLFCTCLRVHFGPKSQLGNGAKIARCRLENHQWNIFFDDKKKKLNTNQQVFAEGRLFLRDNGAQVTVLCLIIGWCLPFMIFSFEDLCIASSEYSSTLIARLEGDKVTECTIKLFSVSLILIHLVQEIVVFIYLYVCIYSRYVFLI